VLVSNEAPSAWLASASSRAPCGALGVLAGADLCQVQQSCPQQVPHAEQHLRAVERLEHEVVRAAREREASHRR
jgi:hypothetical protein